jgi:hypothetical protein
MKLIKRYKIAKDVDLIFAKRDLGNFLKREKKELLDFFTFSTMELGTNLLKHATKGEIWLLEAEGRYYLASLDKGPGIEDTKWCVQKGNTTYKNSLGLGLYSLSKFESYELEIFSIPFKGTVCLLRPKESLKQVCFQMPYVHEKFIGDLIVRRDEYTLFADITGHGKRAWESANVIKEIFLTFPKKFLFYNDFFKFMDEEIKKYKLRSAVVCLVKNDKTSVDVMGVGNIGVFYRQNDQIYHYFLKPGILGEVFTHINIFSFDKKDSKIVLITDGIDDSIVEEVLETDVSNEILALSCIFFSQKKDDKSIFIIGER